MLASLALMRRAPRLCSLALLCAAALPACDSGSNDAADAGSGTAGDDGGTDLCFDGTTQIPAVDESSCAQLDSDYRPLDPGGDSYDPCIVDDGDYALAGTSSPGSLTRVQGYEDIAALLWIPDTTPTADDFTAARTVYDSPENLGSRIARREDLHYPEIPEADQDPAIDADKQCTVSGNPAKYPERCAGPALMSPLVETAFAAGQTGEGVPEIHAARIQATLLWFFYLSIYKEAYTCAVGASKDCDSMWAKYTGGEARTSARGYSGEVRPLSTRAHEHTYDALLGMRCWRDLYPEDTYPAYADIPAEGQALFDTSWEALDNALHRTWALLLRDRLAQLSESCSVDAAADWAFLQVAGPVLTREATERDATMGANLAAIFASDEPTAEDVDNAVGMLDALFTCAQP